MRCATRSGILGIGRIARFGVKTAAPRAGRVRAEQHTHDAGDNENRHKNPDSGPHLQGPAPPEHKDAGGDRGKHREPQTIEAKHLATRGR